MYKVDKEYCMSSFLALRYVAEHDKIWAENIIPRFISRDFTKADVVYTAEDIDKSIRSQLEKIDLSKTGIMLSGGMDSAILATYLPKGAKAYTMRTIAEGSVNEVEQAKVFADMCGLDLTVVDITWEDYLKSIPVLAKHKKSPFHSIEPQIYKTFSIIKQDGLDNVLSGENADSIFGGLDGLMSKDWLFDDFVKRYIYLDPKDILNNYTEIASVYEPYRRGNYIDFFGFVAEVFAEESLNSYIIPAELAGINFIAPYANMKMGGKVDLERIRNGESKYLIRELFKIKYPGIAPNKKLPMPRAVGVWLKDWQGPTRPEFKKVDINMLKPDQKWLVYILEQFLNMLDNGELYD